LYYSRNYYKFAHENAYIAAKEIAPIILKLIQPKSIIDLGCGMGSWLSVFKNLGINDVFGIDGNWLNEKMLLIPKDNFLRFDLSKPLYIVRQFDLAISLEVAEHIPATGADIFIESLTRLSPVILFSAAIPFQPGIHHKNAQWPEYWQKKFLKNNYICIDCIRKKIWQNDSIPYWYAQNILLFVRKNHLDKYSLLVEELGHIQNPYLSVVHPKTYLAISDPNKKSFLNALLELPLILRSSISRLVKRIITRF